MILDRVFLTGGSTVIGAPYWIGRLGGAATDVGYSVAVDGDGNVYACGYSTDSGLLSLQIAKYNTSGAIQWQRRLSPASGNVYGYSIAVDSSANVYVCGFAANGIQLAKYNTSGTIQWQRRLNATATNTSNGIAVDSSGNVYICGTSSFSGTEKFQIAKYNTSGTIQWQRELGDANNSYGKSVAVDSSGNVYVCGYALGAGASNDIQIAKYDTSGSIQWQRRLGSSATEAGYSIAVDSSGNAYVCGFSNATGNASFQIAKYDTSGTIQWQRRLGGSGNAAAYSIAVDSSSNVYVFGTFDGTGSDDFLIAKYDTSGSIQWQRGLGSTSSAIEQGNSIAVDSSGNVYVCGYTDVGGTNDFLFAKLPGNGSLTGTYSVGGNSFDYAATTMTDAATSLTSATSSLTDAATTLTDSATTLTDAASTLTSSVTTI